MMIVTAVSASIHIDRINVATVDIRLSMSLFTLSPLSYSGQWASWLTVNTLSKKNSILLFSSQMKLL